MHRQYLWFRTLSEVKDHATAITGQDQLAQICILEFLFFLRSLLLTRNSSFVSAKLMGGGGAPRFEEAPV